MKKIILSFILLASIMLSTMSTAKAITVTFYVTITLSDTCSPSPYHGYYCVRLELLYNSALVCQSENCKVLPGTDCYAFTCNVDNLASGSHYGVLFQSAFRSPSGDCLTTNGTNSGFGFSWDDMTTYPCNNAWISVTL